MAWDFDLTDPSDWERPEPKREKTRCDGPCNGEGYWVNSRDVIVRCDRCEGKGYYFVVEDEAVEAEKRSNQHERDMGWS